MVVRFSRAHRMFLDLPGDHSGFIATAIMPQDVVLTCAAQDFLLTQIQPGGSAYHRSGPLFGHWDGHNLIVKVARCGQAQPTQDQGIFPLDGKYILGLSDGLRGLEPDIDWIGHWIIAPDRFRPAPEVIKLFVETANRFGLVSYDIPLLICGWDEFAFWHAAFVYSLESGIEELPVQIRKANIKTA